MAVLAAQQPPIAPAVVQQAEGHMQAGVLQDRQVQLAAHADKDGSAPGDLATALSRGLAGSHSIALARPACVALQTAEVASQPLPLPLSLLPLRGDVAHSKPGSCAPHGISSPQSDGFGLDRRRRVSAESDQLPCSPSSPRPNGWSEGTKGTLDSTTPAGPVSLLKVTCGPTTAPQEQHENKTAENIAIANKLSEKAVQAQGCC